MYKNTRPIRGPVHENYDIIIPAAGMGRRMKSYGPKALISVRENLTIIDNQLKIIKQIFAKSRIILVCGFQCDKLMSSTPNDIIKLENEKYEESNVIRSIGIGLRASLSNKVIIIYGDLVFNKQALNNSFDTESTLIIDSSDSMPYESIGCIVNDQNNIEHTFYDIPNKWGQILYLTNKELDLMKKVSWNRDNKQMFGFEAINEIIKHGGKFRAVSPKNAKIIDVDTSKDIEKARQII
jgi:choline kinase